MDRAGRSYLCDLRHFEYGGATAYMPFGNPRCNERRTSTRGSRLFPKFARRGSYGSSATPVLHPPPLDFVECVLHFILPPLKSVKIFPADYHKFFAVAYFFRNGCNVACHVLRIAYRNKLDKFLFFYYLLPDFYPDAARSGLRLKRRNLLLDIYTTSA